METLDMLIRAEFIPTDNDVRDNDYYKGEFNVLPKIEPEFEPVYKLDFPMPYSPKIRYYCQMIDNEVIGYLNNIFKDDTVSDFEIAYHRRNVERWVGNKLGEIGSNINDYGLDMSEITGKTNYALEPQRKDCTFLLNYLAASLVRCYMEFQSKYFNRIDELERYKPEYLYTTYMKQSPSGNYIIPVLYADSEIDAGTDNVIEPPVDPAKRSLKYLKTGKNAKQNLEDALISLKLSGMVDPMTKQTTFDNIFSGKEPSTPVVWIGNVDCLTYFIRGLKNGNAIDKKDRSIWKVVVRCFVGKNGVTFEPRKLRGQHPPKIGVDSIDKVIELMI